MSGTNSTTHAVEPWYAALFATDPTLTASDVTALPQVVIGQTASDGLQSAHGMVDDSGNPIVQSIQDAVLSAIYALAKEMRDMSDALTTIITALQTQQAAITTALTELAAQVAAGPTPAELTALQGIETTGAQHLTTLQSMIVPATPPAA